MADVGAPSFSLGLDLDPDPDPGGPNPALPLPPRVADVERDASSSAPTFRIFEFDGDDDDFNPESLVIDRREDEVPRPRALKRLKRGAPVTPSSAPPSLQSVQAPSLDEEIEEFSSDDEDPRIGAHAKIHSQPPYSSSKLSLCHQRVLNRESTAKMGCTESASAFNSSSFGRLNPSDRQGILPRLTVSPIRRIQLLDSDSDDPSSSNCNHQKVEIEGACLHVSRNQPNKEKFQTDVPKEEYFQNQISDFATPALDEFCKEYFASTKEKEFPPFRKEELHVKNPTSSPGCFLHQMESTSQMNSRNENVDYALSSSDPLPPSFHYYNHKDSRIRELVHDRLPNFSPTGAANQMSNQKSEATNIDYMSQFCHRDIPAPRSTMNKGCVGSKKKSEQNVKKPNTKGVPQASGSWVNPKDYSTIPKDAGRRQFHANGNACGHWFTGEDGRKEYVTKDGKQLSGQAAYRHYRKESGVGFKRARNKSLGKKKTKKR